MEKNIVICLRGIRNTTLSDILHPCQASGFLLNSCKFFEKISNCYSPWTSWLFEVVSSTRIPLCFSQKSLVDALWFLSQVTLGVANLGWVDLNIDVPLSAKICLGQWQFGIIGGEAKQDDRISILKSTEPRFAPSSVTLYTFSCSWKLTLSSTVKSSTRWSVSS